MRTGVLLGVGTALALVVVSVTDASACSRRGRVCGAYAPAPVYQYAPPPPVYRAPPPAAYYAPPNGPVGYGYARPAYGYGTAAGYGYRNCDCGYGRARGYGYAPPAPVYGTAAGYGYRNCDRGNGGGYGYAPPVAYDYDDDDYRPAAVWVPGR